MATRDRTKSGAAPLSLLPPLLMTLPLGVGLMSITGATAADVDLRAFDAEVLILAAFEAVFSEHNFFASFGADNPDLSQEDHLKVTFLATLK